MRESQLGCVYRYVNGDIIDPNDFDIVGSQLCLHSFQLKEAMCLSLIIMELSQHIFDEKHVIFPLKHYIVIS